MAAPAASSPTESASLPDASRPALLWLFHFCAFLTAVVWLEMVIGFIRQSAYNSQTGFSTEVLLLFLGAYGGMKEFKRVAGTLPPESGDQRILRGEFFLVFWAVTAVAMDLAVKAGWHGVTQLPHDLRTVLWGVAGIFFGTYCSKSVHEKKLPWTKGTLPPTVPQPTDGGLEDSPPASDDDPDAWYVDRVVALLKQAGKKGCTRAEIQQLLKGGDANKPLAVLHRLMAADLVVRSGKGPRDPNTRYIWKECLDGGLEPALSPGIGA